VCIDINTFNTMPKKILKTHFLKLAGEALGVSRSSYVPAVVEWGNVTTHMCAAGVSPQLHPLH
jgi:hypothetical protein